LDSAGLDSLDITSAEVLKALLVDLKGKGIDLYVAEMHAPVREFGQRTGLLEIIGEDHIFPTVDAAVRFIEMSTQPESAERVTGL
jgi:SulP family sulfate permease